MDKQNILSPNNKILKNNNDILLNIVNRLENIINDLNNKKGIDIIIKQLKNAILLINDTIKQNKNSLNEDSNKKVKDLEIDKNNDDNEIKTKIYEFGKYMLAN